MSLSGSLVLTTFLSVQNPQVGFNNPSKEAIRYISKALFIELNLDEMTKNLEKKYSPEWVSSIGPYLYVGYRITIEKRISYRWTF